MNLTNFGEQFASKVLKKTYQDAVFMAITNRDYEGDIKKPGDRVNILSFLNGGEMQDYVVGTDMAVQQMVDAEDQLIVEKRKAYNLSMDRLESLFTYADDIPDAMILEYSKTLERITDAYVLDKFGSETKAGSWVGVDFMVYGGGSAGGTAASIATTATGGTVTITSGAEQFIGGTAYTSAENPRDGATYFAGFENSDLYKGFRLRSTAAFVTPWYRISGITSSSVATLTEWDEATSGPDFEEGYTLRGLFGGDGINFTKYGTGDAALITQNGLGWEIQSAAATAVTSSVIYNQVTLLAEALDQNEVENQNRHFTVPPQLITQLKQASQLQPTGIAEVFIGTVLNGRVMRVGAFDVHEAAGSRVSTRSGHSTASGTGADTALTTGATGYILPANHTGMMTYADKWSESRVVDSINQFAKQYQGLFLFGAKVPRYRRKYGAVLFGSF